MECGCDDMRGSGRESMGKAITKDSVFDSMRRVEAALKLRYMGIGFVWAWLYCTYATSAVFPYRSGQSINSDESWLLSAVAVVLGFLVGGLLLSRRPLGGHCLRRFSIAAALLLAAGTIVSALGAFALGLAWLGGAMTGVGYALLSLLWARALMVLDVEELEAVVPLSSLVIVPCVVVYPLLEGVVGVVATASLPLMSGVLRLLCLRAGAKRCGVEEAASGVGGMSPTSRKLKRRAPLQLRQVPARLYPDASELQNRGASILDASRLFSWCCISPSGGRPLWPMSATVCMRSSILMSPCSFPALPA